VRDIDIRKALFAGAFKEHEAEPDTLIVEELGLNYGEARVDVAVINGAIHGFEIKSEKDTLDRLPAQLAVYSAALDYVTLVVHESHVQEAVGIIPRWWGVQVVKGTPEAVHFRQRRSSKRNPKLDSVSVLRLLWKDEALALLDELGLAKGMKSKPKEALYLRIADALSPTEVGLRVRTALKHRANWRVPVTAQ
jgi:hypothetical protein